MFLILLKIFMRTTLTRVEISGASLMPLRNSIEQIQAISEQGVTVFSKLLQNFLHLFITSSALCPKIFAGYII